MLLSRDVCTAYAVKLVNNANAIYMLADENVSLKEDWETFVTEMKYEKKEEKKYYLQQDMLDRIDLAEKNVMTTCLIDSAEMKISNYHSFLLSLNGISSQEIAISPSYSTLIYNDFFYQLEALRNSVNEPNSLNIRFGTMLLDIFVHTTNAYYIAVLAELSSFPEASLNTYHQMSPLWHHYPKQYKLGESEKYYEDLINTETALSEEKMSRFETILEQQDAELYDLEKKLDEMEYDMDNKVRQIENDIYSEFKQNNTIQKGDGQWYQWGKISHWGNYLSLVVTSKREDIEKGIDYESSITPDVVCSDIISQLSVYQRNFPESKDYVASVKKFYRELSEDKLDYAGVLVFAFQDGEEHSISR